MWYESGFNTFRRFGYVLTECFFNLVRTNPELAHRPRHMRVPRLKVNVLHKNQGVCFSEWRECVVQNLGERGGCYIHHVRDKTQSPHLCNAFVSFWKTNSFICCTTHHFQTQLILRSMYHVCVSEPAYVLGCSRVWPEMLQIFMSIPMYQFSDVGSGSVRCFGEQGRWRWVSYRRAEGCHREELLQNFRAMYQLWLDSRCDAKCCGFSWAHQCTNSLVLGNEVLKWRVS